MRANSSGWASRPLPRTKKVAAVARGERVEDGLGVGSGRVVERERDDLLVGRVGRVGELPQ